MQVRTVIIALAGLSAVSATIPANPVVKHLPARALNYDGSFGGLIFKRQTSCPEGYTACGSGCAQGPCCDNGAGYACRTDEVCQQINGAPACCPNGYTCGSIRTCETTVGTGCVPGTVSDGVLCCDASAPMCDTSGSVPYCAGAAPDTTYTIAPEPDNTSGPTSGPTDTVVTTDTVTTDTAVTYDSTSTSSTTETETATITIPTTYPTDVTFTIQTSTPTDLPTYIATDTTTTSVPTSTYTATIVIPQPYPTGGNGTAGNATATVSPPEQTGAAGKLGVSSFALTVLMGLAFAL